MVSNIRKVRERYSVYFKDKSYGNYNTLYEAQCVVAELKNKPLPPKPEIAEVTLNDRVKQWAYKQWLTDLFCDNVVPKRKIYEAFNNQSEIKTTIKYFNNAFVKAFPGIETKMKYSKERETMEHAFVLDKKYCPEEFMEQHKNICIDKMKMDFIRKMESKYQTMFGDKISEGIKAWRQILEV